MVDVKILKHATESWEGLYIDGKLIEEAHHIGEGMGLLHVLHPYVNGKEWTHATYFAAEEAHDDGFPQTWDEVVVD